MAAEFSINDAVAHSLSLDAGKTESLAELDSGMSSCPPFSVWTSGPKPATITSSSKLLPVTHNARDKDRSKAKRRAIRSTKVDALLDPRPQHPRHYTSALPTIKTKFDLCKARIAATGWIGLRDDGVAPEEEEVGAEEEGPAPTHSLADFFGAKARFHGFHLAKYLGPCVF